MTQKKCMMWNKVLLCLATGLAILCIWLGNGVSASAAIKYYKKLDVKYQQSTARAMLSLINEFRTGDNAWAWNESNTEKIYYNNLQNLQYDYELERVAMLRAAEIAIRFSHTRPNETSCFAAYDDLGYDWWSAIGENIAYGYTTYESVYLGWREDNDEYKYQGHRRNMLSSDFKAIGIGHVVYNGTHYWVQEFSGDVVGAQETEANDSNASVLVEMTTGAGTPYYVVDEENFPDAKFRAYVSEVIDLDHDGVLSSDERLAVTGIDCTGTNEDGGISSLQGIELFANVSELKCDSNQLTSLNLQSLPRLTVLSCGNNQLTTMNLTGNTLLKSLDCHANQLDSLNLSACTELEALNCHNNLFSILDVTGNPLINAYVTEGIRQNYTDENVWQYGSFTVDKTVSLLTVEGFQLAFKHNCSFGNNLSFYFAVPTAVLEGYTNLRLSCEKKYDATGVSYITETIELTNPVTTLIGSSEYYMFEYRNIAAKEMGDEITATLLADKGDQTYFSNSDTSFWQQYRTGICGDISG